MSMHLYMHTLMHLYHSISTMPTQGNNDDNQRDLDREGTNCPICGNDFKRALEVHRREVDGEAEEMPGIVYIHRTSNCAEWADREIGRPLVPKRA